MAMAEHAAISGRAAPARRQASWWGRVGATILDGVIVAVPALLSGAASAAGVDALASLLAVVYVLAVILYAPVLLARNRGRTWGKQAAEVRVERLDGAPPGFGRAFGRELLKLILGLTVVLWIVDVLWPLWQPEGRALHDLAAGTRVVAETGRAV